MYLSGNIRLHWVASAIEEVVSCGGAGDDSGKRKKQKADHLAAGQ